MALVTPQNGQVAWHFPKLFSNKEKKIVTAPKKNGSFVSLATILPCKLFGNISFSVKNLTILS